ncbi:MAG: hypothetical protein CM1200mP28_18000 [Deltaproteobacteria bacterium]|nr:MAG: hypothetical protein CM1200mP28_18000 [Deltaproteobacteria bacterium]
MELSYDFYLVGHVQEEQIEFPEISVNILFLQLQIPALSSNLGDASM